MKRNSSKMIGTVWKNMSRGSKSDGLCSRSSGKASLPLLLVIFALVSCSESTAIRGTPVNEVALHVDRVEPTRVRTKENMTALAAMSRVKENSTFLETGGLPEYRIGPLDVLEISSYVGDKVTTTTVTVDGRGTISYSFLDNIVVSGLTPGQVDGLLTRKLSSYVRKPRVRVLVKEFKSKSATIAGEFSILRTTTYGTKAASGRITLKGKTTLMDLIAYGSGYTVNADIKNVKLIRQGKSHLINVYDIIEKGDESQNVIIDDGDVVNIPELPQYGERVYVMGEVAAQGIYPLKDAQDLLAAIALAGNTTALAKEEDTLIVRDYQPDKPPLVMTANLRRLFRQADLSQNIRLKDGDLIYVPSMRIKDINNWIINMTPLLNLMLYPGEFADRYFTGYKVKVGNSPNQ
jgi:protein involved in polysaccharide export with SLBB domain